MLAIYSINILIYNEKNVFQSDSLLCKKNFVSFSKTRKSNEMMQKHKCLIDFILTVASQIAYADLPLSLEELLTDKGKFKLESSISYINTERNQ
ncbi:membrane protein, partial [Neisseria meningitidis]